MVMFAALFIVTMTILFGAFGQRIQEFLQENVLGMLLGLLSSINGGLRGSTEAEEDVEPLTPSPSSPTTGSEFEVFLSFRGEDTRKRFIGHLYEGLEERGVATFIDSEKLEKGEEIDKLLEYIERSKIFVPIFSKRFAESKWCLQEVTKSLECGQEIVPVFFGVDPSDVRYQRGPFKSAFRKHESNKQQHQEEVRKWREALKKVANISGFNLKEMNGDEAKLKGAVIKRVLDKVNKMPLQVAKHQIGIETRVRDVKKMLENGGNINGVQVVGIHGMGGLGKTTIARAVYNDLAKGFNGVTCFLSNIRAKSKEANGLVDLQTQLIGDTLKGKDISLSDVAEGKNLIKKRAHRKRVLLILDDVDSAEQLDALAGGRDWFGSGSVIIITTRDEKVLLARNVERHKIYKPEVLNAQQSRELFLLHAFNDEEPKGEYLRLSNEVVATAGGLPLTIKVLGSLLTRGMDVEQWQNTLDRLKRIPPDEVQERLKLSYDRLDKTEKKIFLDISCLFIGRAREYATYMWEGCRWFPNYAIEVLEQRSLLKTDWGNGEFEMHDQIRDMGRAIVEKKCSGRLEKQSRLWISQDSLDFLRKKVPGTIDAEAIQIWPDGHERYFVSAEWFENMPNLRYLDAAHLNFQGTPQCFPPYLKWLQLYSCHFEPMPSDFNLEEVVVLHLWDTNMAQVLINQLPLKAFEKLKVLSIHDSEISVIPDLTNVPCLVKLDVSFCSKLTTIDESIGKLKKLTDLHICYNDILSKLPDSTGELSSLKKLSIRGTSIVMIPESICQLSSLEILHLEDCWSLTSLPERLGDMSSLEKLLLRHTSIIKMPDSIGQLTNLCELLMDNCWSLTSLPEQLGDMRSLEKLQLSGTSIIKMSDSVGQLTNLSELLMQRCKRLLRLPDYICQLSFLEVLDLSECCILCFIPECIGDMESLKKLDLSGTQIGVIPDAVCHLSLLETLILKGCYNLCSLPERLGDMEKLEELFLDDTRIEVIPDSIGQLKNLRFLSLAGCKSLKTLPDSMRTLSSLQTLVMSRTKLNYFDHHLSHLAGTNMELTCSSSLLFDLCDQSRKALKHIHLKDAAIEELPNCVGGMESLEQLQLECDMLKELPNWIERYSEKLARLMVRSNQLKALPDCIGPPKQLRHLTLKCENLKALPNSIGSLKQMGWLKWNCINLESLPDSIGGLQDIYYFRIKSVKLNALQSSIALLGVLCQLDLHRMSLEGMPNSIRWLKRLDCFDMQSNSLKDLPASIGLLKDVRFLRFKCSNLEKLPNSIGELERLSSFVVDSHGLICLPNSIGSLTRIKFLYLNCLNLEALPEFMENIGKSWTFKIALQPFLSST